MRIISWCLSLARTIIVLQGQVPFNTDLLLVRGISDMDSHLFAEFLCNLLQGQAGGLREEEVDYCEGQHGHASARDVKTHLG